MQFTSFRLSAEAFWAALFGDEVLDICDYILPEEYDSTQYFVFLISRVILAIYGILFTILILSVITAIVSMDVGDKVCSYRCIYFTHTVEQYSCSQYQQIVMNVRNIQLYMQCPWKEQENNGKTSCETIGNITTVEEEKFTWKVILKWATASEAAHFPGPKFPIVNTNTGMHIQLAMYAYIAIGTYIRIIILMYTTEKHIFILYVTLW